MKELTGTNLTKIRRSLARFTSLCAIACIAGASALHAAETPELPASSPAPATEASTATLAVPDDPLGRGTPRSTIEKFFAAADDGDYALAARYLDLSGYLADARASQGPRLARALWFVLERQELTDFRSMSASPLGDLSDGLPPNREKLARIEWKGGYVDLDLERVPEGDVRVWKLSARSVAAVPALFARFRWPIVDRFIPQATQDAFLQAQLFGISGISWILLLVAAVAWFVLLYAGIRLGRRVIPQIHPGFGLRLVSTIYLPVVVLLVTGFVGSLLPQRGDMMKMAFIFQAHTIPIIVAVWILFRFTDFAGQQIKAKLLARDGDTGFSLLDLLRRIAKVTIAVIGLVVWLDNMGFSVTTILASLGVAGLAVGLASKNFIEDLIGAMTLHATGVVKRNESIRFGGKTGYVEDIGLRVTTIRTGERSLITMPNAAFAAMQIENLGRRDKTVFQTKLGLRYETTPDQLRNVLLELRKLLFGHPKVAKDGARVRFVSFGASSLDLDLFCFITETSHAEYLAVVEELNLRILEIIAESGTGFAFPSQTIYFEPAQGGNVIGSRGPAAQAGHEQGELCPDTFPHALIREMEATVKFPESGSSN